MEKEYVPLHERIEAARSEGLSEIKFYGLRINTDIQTIKNDLAGFLTEENPLEPEKDYSIDPKHQL